MENAQKALDLNGIPLGYTGARGRGQERVPNRNWGEQQRAPNGSRGGRQGASAGNGGGQHRAVAGSRGGRQGASAGNRSGQQKAAAGNRSKQQQSPDGPGKPRSGKRGFHRLILAAMLVLPALLIASIRITHITVAGNERYTDQQIIDRVFPGRYDRNPVYSYLKDRFRPHAQIPFVEDYEIVFTGLNQVDIIVYEKSVVGYVEYMSSYMYFDKDGIIVESANEKVTGIPWVTGLKFGQIVLYQPLPVENSVIFGEIMNLTQNLYIYGIAVDEIQYNQHGEAVLYIDGIKVIVGSNEEINGKIAELHAMLPQLCGRLGTLYLDRYEGADSSRAFSFVPGPAGTEK